MKKKLVKNKDGLLTVNIKPNEKKLRKFYKDDYYQKNLSKSYKKKYSYDEIKFNELYFKLSKLFFKKKHKTILDIGTGEGYLLSFFKKYNYKCYGVDYSLYGIKNHNPKLLKKVEFINCDIIKDDFFLGKQFDIIFLMGVAEHVSNFNILIKKIYKKLKKNGILIIKVPNEYDIIHKKYLKNNNLKKEQLEIFNPLHHLNYFNKESLKRSITNNINLKCVTMYSDFPIEMFILNKFTNYYKNESFGKNAHDLRVKITNLIQEQNKLDKILKYYQLSLELGLGREITAIFEK
jgi:2-polyprenyl-3-methyl-5-hydroxy-6-metoxy-1,4-benzoquinol methylase